MVPRASVDRPSGDYDKVGRRRWPSAALRPRPRITVDFEPPRFAGGLRRCRAIGTSWIRTSARRSSPLARRRIIGSVNARFRDRTSETRPREPIIGSTSRCRRFFCSMRTRCLDGIRCIDGPMAGLIGFDERDQDVQAIPFGGAGYRIHQLVDLREGRLVVVFGVDRSDLDLHQMASASILSYSSCVPTNRTYTTRYG